MPRYISMAGAFRCALEGCSHESDSLDGCSVETCDECNGSGVKKGLFGKRKCSRCGGSGKIYTYFDRAKYS